MPVYLEQLPDEPILTLTYIGPADVDTVRAAFERSLPYIEAVQPRRLYRISDMRAATANFTDVMSILKLIKSDAAGSTADSRVYGVFVGGNQLTQMYVDAIRQLNLEAGSIPFFKVLDEALDYVRFKIKADQSETSL